MRKKSTETFCIIDRLVVKSLLARKDWTANDLADALGISFQYMSELIRGQRNAAAYIPRIAKVLGVSAKSITLLVSSSSSSTGQGRRAPLAAASSRE